jgi:hypothetical protein
MDRPINGDSTVTQLWNPITLRKPEDGGDFLSETSGLTTATRHKVFALKRYPTMERPNNSESAVTQLWNPISVRNPEDGGDMASETSVLTRATRYKVPEDIYNLYRRQNIQEDSVLRPYMIIYEFCAFFKF